jgi:hypothetical protein
VGELVQDMIQRTSPRIEDVAWKSLLLVSRSQIRYISILAMRRPWTFRYRPDRWRHLPGQHAPKHSYNLEDNEHLSEDLEPSQEYEGLLQFWTTCCRNPSRESLMRISLNCFLESSGFEVRGTGDWSLLAQIWLHIACDVRPSARPCLGRKTVLFSALSGFRKSLY